MAHYVFKRKAGSIYAYLHVSDKIKLGAICFMHDCPRLAVIKWGLSESSPSSPRRWLECVCLEHMRRYKDLTEGPTAICAENIQEYKELVNLV